MDINTGRIINSSELPRGYMNEWERASMRKFNENPQFDNETKPYNFISKIKSNTDVHGWLFEYAGSIYAATQKLMFRGPETVHIYNASDKGKFDVMKYIGKIERICDIETAVDRWVADKK